jgi:hypothetical protein
MPFLIDGHNLLWAIHKTTGEPVADIQLCHVLGRYLKLINETGVLVFDGIGPPDKTPFGNTAALEVLFSGLRKEADDIIEDKIKANTAPKRLTVVSSDRRVRKAANARKAISIKSENFWENVKKQLSKKKPIKEPMEKRHGLSKSETDQWLKFFDID